MLYTVVNLATCICNFDRKICTFEEDFHLDQFRSAISPVETL